MKLPNPSLNSVKGFAVLLLAVAVAVAVLSQTNIGNQLQGAVNSGVSRLPV